MRVALPQFWEYIDAQLDACLGGHRLDAHRRELGATPQHDTEGTQWFGDYPDELPRSGNAVEKGKER